MSHTMNIQLQMKDKDVLRQALDKLNVRHSQGTFQLFATQETGIGFLLPGWKYPAVVLEDGSVACDNYNGRWGDIKELKKIEAHYGIEKAKIEAYKQGYWCTEGYDETTKELILTINVGVN